MKYHFIIPLRVNRNKIKVRMWTLNLNQYSQIATCTHARNQVKQNYKKLLKESLEGHCKINGPMIITYTIFPKTRREFDVRNVGSILDKFFADALTHYGIIEDDNFKFIPEVRYRYGEVSSDAPRCEVEIEEI